MKKVFVLITSSLLLITLFFFYRQSFTKDSVQKKSTEDFANYETESENEDGIKILQQHEFEITKDPTLGIVPVYRLEEATDRAMKQRMLRENSTNRIESFTWTERGPNSDAVGVSNGNGRPGSPTPVTSGRIRAIWVDLADASNKTVWAGGVDGGIWKTTDVTAFPASWTPVNDYMANLAISSICQDPTNTNIMYCGTGEKTFNVDAVRGGGVWKSTDHGVSWNLLSSTTSFWNVSKVLCDKSGNIYVGTIGSGAGLRRSTDGGSTWTNITPAVNAGGGGIINTTRVADMVYDTLTGKLHVAMGYLPGTSSTIYEGYCFTASPSTVNQTGWSVSTTPIPITSNSIDNWALACSGSNVYALPANTSDLVATIYKSTDGGITWAATGTTPTNSGNNAFTNGQGWYCLAVAVDPANANNVIVGSLNCYKSTDGGSTWSQISVWVSGISGSVTNYIHADQHFGVWNGNQVLIGSDGGIFYSADAGSTFSDRNVNLRIKQFYSCAIHPSTTNYFLAGAQDNGVNQFTAAGLSGTTEVNGGDGGFVAIDQNESAYQFGTYIYNHCHRSTNGGSTWADINFYKGTNSSNKTDFGTFINPFDYDDVNNILYGGGDAGEFFRWTTPQTTSAGSYYASASGPTSFATANAAIISITGFNSGSVSAVKVSPYTSNRVYFGTSNGRIVIVDNANSAATGSAGTNISGASFSAGNISCVNVGTDDNNLIASFSNFGVNNIWVSNNGGTSWAAEDGNLPDIPVRWVMFFPGNNSQAIVATDMGIFETTQLNGASTVWVQESTFPMVRTDMLKYRSNDRTIVAATHGRGLWSAILPIVLPVKLTNFEGHLFNNVINLSWNTSVENNNKAFEVQKSSDGINFYSIGYVNGSGNSALGKSYSLIDGKVNDINYYRLKIIDINGNYVYSSIILVKNSKAQQYVWAINNPFKNYIDLRFSRQANTAKLQLITLNGKIVSEKVFTGASGQQRWQLSNNLSRGVYVLRIISDGIVFTNKLVKE